MGITTPPPGPLSFTNKLIKELAKNMHLHGQANVSDVYTYLLQEDRHLSQTPNRVPLLGRRQTICLERLDSPTSVESHSRETASFSFHFSLSQDPTERILGEIVAWLKDRPPRAISSEASFKTIVLHAQPLRDYISFTQDRGASLTAYGNLSPSSSKDIQSNWSRLGALLSSAFTLAKWITPKASTRVISNSENTNELDSILSKLKDSITTLQNAVDRGIQDIPALNEESCLQQAIEETMIARLQATVESLKIRRIGQLESPQLEVPTPLEHAVSPGIDESKPFQSLSLVNHESHGTILSEYKYYEKENMSSHQVDLDKKRMQKLCKVLETPTPGDFGTLKCRGWSWETDLERFAIHFEPPEGCESRPTSLRKVLSSKKRGRPSLGERFMIAKSVGQSLLKWHTTGWVHQGIASHNIIFFQQEGSPNLDFSKPYLCGFDYARCTGNISVPRHLAHLGPEYDLYRHKERQDIADVTHTKEHDIYSFGLLLVEIGFWDTLKNIFFDGKKIEPRSLREVILKRMRNNALLEFEMGKAYERATLTCIKGSFHVERDDPQQSHLAQAFEREVVHKITDGHEIDNLRPSLRV